MQNRLISVVVTFYNAESTIRDTIDSIVSQDYKFIQVLFVDGKSTDNSLEIVKENAPRFNNIKIISESDDGIYDGMNKGVIGADGDVVAILNADDYFQPGALTLINDLFEGSVDIVAGTIQRVLPSGEKEKIIYRSEFPMLSPSSATIHHPSVFVKKRVYDEIGLFNTDYKISADYDFIARAVNYGVNIAYTDKVITNMRVGGVSDSIEFHSKKNLEHLRIGVNNIHNINGKVMHIYYVLKKYIYGILKYKGLIKR